jgi:hypothetical protein
VQEPEVTLPTPALFMLGYSMNKGPGVATPAPPPAERVTSPRLLIAAALTEQWLPAGICIIHRVEGAPGLRGSAATHPLSISAPSRKLWKAIPASYGSRRKLSKNSGYG